MMPNNEVKQSFESITPTQEQKERMLANILEQKEKKPIPQSIPFSRKAKPFLAVAASLVIVVSGAITLTQVGDDTVSQSPIIPDQHQEIQNFIAYNGMEYVYEEELVELSEKDLMGPLQKREYTGEETDVIWGLKGYDPKEAIVVEYLGSYYFYKNMNP